MKAVVSESFTKKEYTGLAKDFTVLKRWSECKAPVLTPRLLRN